MVDKRKNRLRRARKSRIRILAGERYRLSVHRTPRHIYAQVISPEGGQTVASASSLDPKIRKNLASGGGIFAAQAVGKEIAQRALEKDIKVMAFDRSGFRYHGRIKALADAVREEGVSI